MIVSRTPMRIPLGGGGTDLSTYSSVHGGFLISIAIDKYSFITVNRRKLDKLIRASYSKTEIVDDVECIEHGLIREALKLTQLDGGLEITSIADIPSGTGLGSSGAFLVGLLNALYALKREPISIVDLVEKACKIEIDILQEPIGKHDQYIVAFGGIRCLDIDRTGHVSVFSPNISEDTLESSNGTFSCFILALREEVPKYYLR